MKNLNPLTALAIFCICLVAVPAAGSVTDVRDELRLALAKVSANEAGFNSPPDTALIYDASGSYGQSPRTRLNWLRRHSRRVLGDRECGNRRNCQWTRNLQWSDAAPVGWDPEQAWVARRWARARQVAHDLVYGHLVMHPCPRVPQTWGGRMDHDRAVSRGLEPLGCVNTLNEGYRYDTADEPPPAVAVTNAPMPEGSIPATIATGRRGD